MDLHPIFAQCVNKELTRYAIDKPFPFKGYVYATDGRICVRCKGEIPPVENKVPNPVMLPWAKSIYKTEPLDLSACTETDCIVCEGSGIINCEFCNNGFCTCDCGDEHKCNECNGSGPTPCTVCHKGSNFEFKTFNISGHWFEIIKGNGGILFDRIDENPDLARYFMVGDEIEGLIMPRKKDDDR